MPGLKLPSASRGGSSEDLACNVVGEVERELAADAIAIAEALKKLEGDLFGCQIPLVEVKQIRRYDIMHNVADQLWFIVTDKIVEMSTGPIESQKIGMRDVLQDFELKLYRQYNERITRDALSVSYSPAFQTSKRLTIFFPVSLIG